LNRFFKRARRAFSFILIVGVAAGFALTVTGVMGAEAPTRSGRTAVSHLNVPRSLPTDMASAHPAPDSLEQRVAAAWPDDPDRAVRILGCESSDGLDPETYDVDAPNGGPLQINRGTWADFFQENFGWPWDQVVNNIDIHIQAARFIYDDSGSWTPWECYTDGLV